VPWKDADEKLMSNFDRGVTLHMRLEETSLAPSITTRTQSVAKAVHWMRVRAQRAIGSVLTFRSFFYEPPRIDASLHRTSGRGAEPPDIEQPPQNTFFSGPLPLSHATSENIMPSLGSTPRVLSLQPEKDVDTVSGQDLSF